MQRFDQLDYAHLSAEHTWKQLGAGSFGAVYLAEYLGLSVAVKQVLPSGEYDVDKYFERECRIMAEARHPNIVQYLGLCLAPLTEEHPERRILIVSEYLSRGNLRGFIADNSLNFPWRLRLSFAIDITRAITYLHARQCLHRDLKCENLLVTENERIKICDFGLSRIAAQTAQEMQRMSYCGTDGYMAPEIITGDEFSLPADIFSLGVILIEILSRLQVGSNTFARVMPSFGLNTEEVYRRASADCPPELIKLALECVQVEPSVRPVALTVLNRLREIETKVLEFEAKTIGKNSASLGKVFNVGSISYSGTMRSNKAQNRPHAPRLPSFQGQVHVPTTSSSLVVDYHQPAESADDETNLFQIAADETNYSTKLVRSRDHNISISSMSSLPSIPSSWLDHPTIIGKFPTPEVETSTTNLIAEPEIFHSAFMEISPELILHRFSLVEPGLQRLLGAIAPYSASYTAAASSSAYKANNSSGRCAVCEKKFGLMKPFLECDDCSFRCHIACSDDCPRSCTQTKA